MNKGDKLAPKVRSRLVVREIKKAKAWGDQLSGSETFSSTPPVEAVYALLSIFMTKDGKKDKKLGSWDISRAHFMGRAAREIIVELPEEDKHHEGDPGPMLGRLLRSMYGAQDASKIFQDDYQRGLVNRGRHFVPCAPLCFATRPKA